MQKTKPVVSLLLLLVLFIMLCGCAAPCPKCEGTKKLGCKTCNDGYVECSDCEGLRYQPCEGCKGSGKEKCERCDGKGYVKQGCAVCAGGSVLSSYDSSSCRFCGGKVSWSESCKRKQTCSICAGTRHNGKACETCDALGEVICRDCAGTEQVYCHYCNGTGKLK